MTFTFITAYYEFDNTKNDFYFSEFYKLVNMNFPILLFLDHNLEYKLDELKKFTNLTVILFRWEDLPINKYINENKIEDISLPIGSNSKDNLKFFILMNSKMHLLTESKKYIADNLFIWIDFGCLKVTRDLDHFKRNFIQIQENYNYDYILIPGGFEPKTCLGNNELAGVVFWRFLGGLIIAPRHLIVKLDEEMNKIIFDLLDRNKIAYEVNLFCNIEFNNENLIRYYKADHSNAMFGFYDIKRIFFSSFDNTINDDQNLVKRVGYYVNNNIYNCDAFCLNIVNHEPSLIINSNIYEYMRHLKGMNCNSKLNIDGKKYLNENDKKLLNMNLIDYCNQLGWLLDYTIGVYIDGSEVSLI